MIKQSHSVIFGDGEKVQERIVWYMAREGGERNLWESGGAFGMASQLVLYPEPKIGVVLLANGGCFSTQDELGAMAKEVRAAYESQ